MNTEEQEYYSIEVCYLDNIDSDLDFSLMKSIPEMLSEFNNLEAEWYFSESYLGEPSHRIMGFGLNRPLDYLERRELHLHLNFDYNGKVFIISY